MSDKFKQLIQRLKNTKFKGLTQYLLYALLLLVIILSGITAARTLWPFVWEYIRFNGIQLIIIFLVTLTVFYNSYKRVTKKSPSKGIVFAFILAFVTAALSFIAINYVVENLLHKGMFSISNYIFINLGLVLAALYLANFDLPRFTTIKDLYASLRESLYKNLGLFLFIFFLASFGGLMNRTFVYAISAAVMFIEVSLLKALLANLRK
jgi:hypothetical protein